MVKFNIGSGHLKGTWVACQHPLTPLPFDQEILFRLFTKLISLLSTMFANSYQICSVPPPLFHPSVGLSASDENTITQTSLDPLPP